MTIFSSFSINYTSHYHTILAINCVHASNWFTHLQQTRQIDGSPQGMMVGLQSTTPCITVSSGLSPVTTSGTSVPITVPYNVNHTVSIVATNCNGNSSAAMEIIRIGMRGLKLAHIS